MKKILNRIGDYFKSIPLYGYIIGVGLVAFQFAFYFFAQYICKISNGASRGAIPFLSIDDQIPFVVFFIIFYVWSYPHWIITFIIASKTNKEEYLDMIFGFVLAVMIGFVIFCAYPTYLDRSKDIWILKYQNKPGFLYDLWRLVCSADGEGGKIGFNMCPSFHCLIATYVYLAVHREKKIKFGFRLYAFIMMILICLSTVFCKQHYIVDIFAGVGLAVICYALAYFIKPGKRIFEYRYIRNELNKQNK